jgi:hypothetical protein
VNEPIRKTLRQLADVDWASLRTAHGTAAHVPDAIRALANADDAEAVNNAYWRLDNYIVLQGTIYPSAVVAIPYILDILLTAPSGPRRVAAYDLLIEIARGVPDPADPSASKLREEARALIGPGRPVYARDLRDAPDGSVRRRALDLLTTFDDDPHGLRMLLDEVEPGQDEQLAYELARARAEA